MVAPAFSGVQGAFVFHLALPQESLGLLAGGRHLRPFGGAPRESLRKA